jgi:hypothetical protein
LAKLIQLLENAFGNPDKEPTPEQGLSKLYQRNLELSQYYADLECIIADLDYNEVATRAALRQGISEELKDAITLRDLPPTLLEFVQKCQKLDTQIRAHKAEKQGSFHRTHHTNTGTQFYLTNTNSGHYGPTPIELAATQYTKLTPELRPSLLQENKCRYCRKVNYPI